MRLLPITLQGKRFTIVQHDDGTFEMPRELAEIKGKNVALKPSQEMWWLCRKPMQGTVAANVLAHGTGALNVEACRVGHRDARPVNWLASIGYGGSKPQGTVEDGGAGRWPPNTVFSHSPLLDPDTGEVIGDACAGGCVDGCVVRELDNQSGIQRDGVAHNGNHQPGKSWFGLRDSKIGPNVGYGGAGGASRYFPCFRWESKAPSAQRPRVGGKSHSTVKPVALIAWLAKLCCPPGGTILDCFAGTGTTGQAARAEGFRAILIENDPESIPLIVARLDARPKTEAPTPETMPVPVQGDLFDLFGGDVA